MNILFDLDGTLTDPREGIITCINHALSTLGQSVSHDSELTRFIRPPLGDCFRELLSSANRVDTAIAAYRERFAVVGMFENSV
ncbi:HAD hydrolase-like protein [Calothrix sp. NIES-3974]|uniref:HAD hydrolase-like protein n=1 Tax=Calothrix sp. NIES-3974 TaxID=2005462 RepID=UPI000BBC9DA8